MTITISIEDIGPKKKNLVTPIPELKTPPFTPPPPEKKPTFLSALNIKLKGIILSSTEEKSVAMITDETNKEDMYYIGATIKDAQIIKIARNRIVLLRSNGQQEVYYLREDYNQLAKPKDKQWLFVINKLDDFSFELDPIKFKREINSLGEFIEVLQLRTAYEQGKPIGIKVGSIDQNEVSSVLGLKQHDIITSINEVTIAEQRNRIEIFDTINTLKDGDTINVALRRDKKDIILSYQLKMIEEPTNKIFMDPAQKKKALQQKGGKGDFSMSRLQKAEKRQREFKAIHPETHKQMIMDLRRRLLENMKTRSKNMRVR